MPSLVVDGGTRPILHISQIASALGLPAPPSLAAPRLGWDIATLLEGWIGRLRGLAWELVLKPTPSRGRTVRNLTVNVFRPVGLLPTAWSRGHFEWDPDEDTACETSLTSKVDLVSYAEGVWSAWTGFLLGAEDELGWNDPNVASPRGGVSFTELLASQRWHAAFHYRQLVEFLRLEGAGAPAVVELELLAGLDLPSEVF